MCCTPLHMFYIQWFQIKKLGEGGFGTVFEVLDTQTTQSFAMKVESAYERTQVLKMEIAVLRRLQGTRDPTPTPARTPTHDTPTHLLGKLHFCRFVGCGRTSQFSYVVMSLTSRTLSKALLLSEMAVCLSVKPSYLLGDLRKQAKEQKFSVSTTIRLSLQCMRALEDLHSIGFLHRDVKPVFVKNLHNQKPVFVFLFQSNFALGRHEHNKRLIYILDFGLARR